MSSIAVVVLSYNGKADTLACLQSLQSDPQAFDVIAVDNASTDGSAESIRETYPGIQLIAFTENKGFTGGMNAGIREALAKGASQICILNNDTIVPSGTIGLLSSAAASHDPCLMHPAIDYADASEGAQLDPSILQHQKLNQLSNDPSIFELRNAYGACLMIPSSVFAKTGLFDDRFYLQLDETDFFLRAQKNGAKALCETKARISHRESAAFGARATPLKTYYIARNTLLLTEKHNRSLPGYLSAVKSLYWSLSHIVRPQPQRIDGEQDKRSLALRGRFIIAAIFGVRDYVLRRFGAASAGTRRILTTP